jgi:hypothetical protein
MKFFFSSQVAASEKRRIKVAQVQLLKPECDSMHEMIAERVRNDCQLIKLYGEVWSRPAVSAVGRMRSEKPREARAQTSPGQWQQWDRGYEKSEHQTSQQSHHETGVDDGALEQKAMESLNAGTLLPSFNLNLKIILRFFD